MSFLVSKVQEFPQSTLQNIPQNEYNTVSSTGLPLLGGLLSNARYAWHAKGPCLEVRDMKTGSKVGSWTFGCILKDSNTRVVCVKEIYRAYGRLSLLAVAIDCTISGGLICIFDIFISKVLRAIQIKEKISSLHVVDSGLEVLNLPGPLHDFDGILAVGTEGGNIYLIDICRQICEESMLNATLRDELYPSEIYILTAKHMSRIDHFRECAVRDGNHLAIHLNLVLHSQTKHFTLKGPNGEDRLFVNKEEVLASALYYCPQLTSLLVGFNFGAFQLWNLTNLTLIYTSPVCDEHLPITHFTFQEPTDDPRAFCYIWVSYSNMDLYQTGLPFAVMYSICYETKEYHEGYGYLYQDFQHCSVRFQVELGSIEEHRCGTPPKGALCLGFQPIYKQPANKELYTNHVIGDTLALCLISWTVWFSKGETQTNILVFDLNQWYKEQMPSFTKWKNCTNFLLNFNVSELILQSGRKPINLLNIMIDEKTLSQFVGVHRLEEHFYPTSLSFDMWTLRESDVVLIRNEGLQKSFLHQIESAGPLCLLRPTDIFKQVTKLGLTPLFIDISSGVSPTDLQREIILNVGLEYQLIGWLCKCASEWANGSFYSAGCSLDFLYNWAFQRANVLKTNCDKYCTPLFDFSQSRLDNNTSILLHTCTRQINNLCTFYMYVQNNLSNFISSPELVSEQYTVLEMISIYFEVLQWLVNVGLLPEGHPSSYPRPDQFDRISAPYPVQELAEFYNEKRAQLRLLSKETFASSESLLFIDNLIENKCGAEQLQKQWQEDGGSGLYPPPSLQSMLRTYLVQGASISHKHSLIIYVFLDLAMALDQIKYSGVITHLIKFPAVFKVSPSIIKITQAFWQLDHGDYTTAIEQLLDPFVLGDDLQPWHHTIAMRALLLQDQYNLALLYMQIRKPPIFDEKDVLTAISLFVANNMLDEAFYFERQHHNNNNEEKLLLHLFNECNKNKLLHSLLYKCLNTNEEKTFFSYLKSVDNPTSDDLQVFYYLLRSRFIEAFDTHTNIKRKKPENQGLIGQRNATTTDQIVKIFQTSLPDVNKNLVDYIRKERANVWIPESRPTPLSVFVHDTKEQIRYKSSFIHAALAKAKNTFADSFNVCSLKELTTEDTPFLRTPTALKKKPRFAIPIVMSKVIEVDECGEEMGPTPSKRLKLTPRTSTTTTTNNNLSIHSKMLTPIVKRKTSLNQDQSFMSNGNNICTPQSILKVRNLVKHSESITNDNVMDEDIDSVARTEISQRSSLGLLPRKSLMRTPKRSHVQFDDAARFSSSLSDLSTQQAEITSIEDQILQKASMSSRDVSYMMSSKSSSISTGDDIFYSPNASAIELSLDTVNDHGNKEVPEINTVEDNNDKTRDSKNYAETQILEVAMVSPRARRSYKRSFADTTLVPFSPWFADNKSLHEKSQNMSEDTSNAQVIVNASPSVSINPPITESPTKQPCRSLEKVKGRKSLSRQVLEHNTFVRRHSEEKVVSKEISVSQTENTVILEKSSGDSKTITINTSLDVLDTSTSSPSTTEITKSHEVTHSILTKTSLETSMDTDSLSSDSDVSLVCKPLPPDLKLSDSLEEYVHFLRERRIRNQTDSRIEEMKSAMINEKFVESFGEEKQAIGEVPENCNPPIDIYEDLSSGTEDIEEILQKSRNFTEEQELDISDNPELEVPIIEKQLENESFELTENSFCLKEGEVAFIGDQSKEDENAESVISISSDDTEGSNHGTTDSQKTERLDDLDVSFESNIQANREHDDDSRSYNTSESTFSSSDSHSLADNDGLLDEAVIIEEPVEDIEMHEFNHTIYNTEENEEINAFQIIELEEVVGKPFIDNQKEDTAILQLPGENILENISEPKQIDNVENKENKKIDDIHIQDEAVEDNISQSRTMDLESKEKIVKEDSEEITIIPENIANKAEKLEDPLLIVDMPKEHVESISKSQENEVSVGSIHITMNKDKKVDDQETIATKSEQLEKKQEQLDKNIEKVDASESIMGNITKKNQSTNTTRYSITKAGTLNEEPVISPLDNPSNIVTKVEQSTNTTVLVFDDKETTEKSLPVEGIRPEDSNENHLKIDIKTMVYDQNTSSSDTTEGDAGVQEIIVTAQIHTPRRKKIAEPLIKRITRRNSALLSQNMEKEQVENISLADSSIKLDCSVDMTTHQISASMDVSDNFFESESSSSPLIPARTMRTRRSSHSSVTKSDKIDCDLDASRHILESPIEVRNRLRKTRSASVDEMRTYSRKRSLRTRSTEENINETMEEPIPRRKGKARSVSQMSAISEEPKFAKKPTIHRKKTGADIDVYSTSRRLTRKQASILKSINTPTNITAEDDSDTDQSHGTETFDPIELLDKEPFEGKPDPEEEKVYVNSSPASSTVSSFSKPTRRLSRSASIASDSSIPQQPKSSTNKNKSEVHVKTSATGTRTSARKHSETSSVISEMSDPATPPKKVKKKPHDITADTVSRSRIVSISSLTSFAQTSARKHSEACCDLRKVRSNCTSEESRKVAHDVAVDTASRSTTSRTALISLFEVRCKNYNDETLRKYCKISFY